MKPGQLLSLWWQRYGLGRLSSPQAIVAAALSDQLNTGDVDQFFAQIPAAFDLQRLQYGGYWPAPFLLKQWERADWQGCHPFLIRWAAEFQDVLRKQKVPVFVHSAFRTEAEQASLVAKGRSKTTRSFHRYGLAVDIVHSRHGWELSRQEWQWLSLVGFKVHERLNRSLPKASRVGLTWGGSWSFYDPAHWQLDLPRIDLPPSSEALRLTPRYVLNSPTYSLV